MLNFLCYGDCALANSQKELTMVSTNSLSRDLKFTVQELYDSNLPGDKEVAETATAELEMLRRVLVPILPYVDKQIIPHAVVRGIVVAQHPKSDNKLVLDRLGRWCSWHGAFLDPANWIWREYVLDDIFIGLERVLTVAVAKKEEHLVAIKARLENLKVVDENIRQHRDHSFALDFESLAPGANK
jgi:hypothetical protein